jgi:hypothetical protein
VVVKLSQLDAHSTTKTRHRLGFYGPQNTAQFTFTPIYLNSMLALVLSEHIADEDTVCSGDFHCSNICFRH